MQGDIWERPPQIILKTPFHSQILPSILKQLWVLLDGRGKIGRTYSIANKPNAFVDELMDAIKAQDKLAILCKAWLLHLYVATNRGQWINTTTQCDVDKLVKEELPQWSAVCCAANTKCSCSTL